MNISLFNIISSWYHARGEGRHQTANPKQQVMSPYDIPGALLEDMVSRGIKPFTVQTISLATAGQTTIEVAGFHIVGFGHDGTPTKAVDSKVYAEMWLENRKNDQGFPMKHARGYSGIFRTVVLAWPAQPGAFMDVVIYSGMNEPYVDGEACT